MKLLDRIREKNAERRTRRALEQIADVLDRRVRLAEAGPFPAPATFKPHDAPLAD